MNGKVEDEMDKVTSLEKEERALLAGEVDSLRKELGGVVNLTAKLNESNNEQESKKRTVKKVSNKKKEAKQEVGRTYLEPDPRSVSENVSVLKNIVFKENSALRKGLEGSAGAGMFGLTKQVLENLKADPQQMPSAARLAASRNLAKWPQPFPGYKGLFSYEVNEEERDTDRNLGNGVYLWTLEIIPGSVMLGEPCLTSNSMSFECVMKKTLSSLPSDACDDMKAQEGKYILEKWTGEAELHVKLFKLDSIIGDQPIQTTICFDKIPLTREILAGSYELELSADDSSIKAIHTSWVEYAQLDPESAAGFLYRVEGGSSVCKHLKPPSNMDLDQKLREAVDHLQGARVWHRTEMHRVFYKPIMFRMLEVGTTTGTFSAELEVAVEYLVGRDDVFHYIIKPQGWKPTWMPKLFTVLNGVDNESVVTHVYPPSLKVYENAPTQSSARPAGQENAQREIRAMIVVNYRGTFTENFELHAFPFDIQGLHVKLHVDQDSSVEMVRDVGDGKKDERMTSILSKGWMITEWRFLDLRCRSAETKCGQGAPNSRSAARMFIICRVQRYARSYLIRIMGVIILICLLSSTIFVIDPMDALGEMVGHSFMMLLTLTTYSLVVADILPVLGYLTLLDNFVLLSFVLLSFVVFEVAFLGWIPDYKEEYTETEIKWWAKTFAIGNILTIVLVTVLISIYVQKILIPREERKPVEDPEAELKSSLRFFKQTSNLDSRSRL